MSYECHLYVKKEVGTEYVYKKMANISGARKVVNCRWG